jgi:ribonuclease BN (tRNA processing enzyme)
LSVAGSGSVGLELVILGAGPAYSDRVGDVGASYLVRGAGAAIVLDLGQGAFPALASATDPYALAAVAISHLHPDHFVDLVPLRHFLLRAEAPPGSRARVMAPVGLDARLDGLYGQPGFTAAAFDLEAPPTGIPVAAGPFRVEARRVRHAGESVGYRVSLADGPGIVYSGDIAVAEDLSPLLRPGDVLLSEASYGIGPVPDGMPHLDGPMVGRLAASAGAGQVVITHLRMGSDGDATVQAVRREFIGPVTLARPGVRLDW